MKGFIADMLKWYPVPNKPKNPDQLELPLDEPTIQEEAPKT